jgi:hypothetical protein
MNTKQVPRARIALLAALVAAPLAAAEVYVPALDPASGAGTRSETQLWISNTSSTAGGAFKSLYLTQDSDGTQRPTPGGNNNILAKRSFKVVSLGQDGKNGLVAIELANGLAAEARIVTTANGETSVGRVPVISDLNRMTAGAKAELLSLERDPARGRVSHLGIVNLGTTATTCTVELFRVDGSQIGAKVILAFKPLSLRHFPDALQVLGESSIEGVRAEVSCAQPFYAYAAIHQATNPYYHFVTPAAVSSGGSSTPLTCGTGALCYDFPGVVHTSTVSNPSHSITLSPPVAAYSRLKLRLEVQINGFHPPSDGAHGLLYLIRNKNKDMYANIFLQGPGKNQIILRHGFELTHGQKPKIAQGFTPVSGTTYTLDYLFDPVGKQLVMTLSQGTQELVRFADVPNVNKVHIDDGHKIIVGLSNPFCNNQVEPCSAGWVYKNLHVELIP